MSLSRGTLCRLSPVAAAVAAALLSPLATAQSTPAVEDELEEVVVTARFREESLQSTPVAISAFSADDLEARSVTNVSDLGSTVPNAFIRQQPSNFGPTQSVGMRGMIQGDMSFSFDPAVGIYIDDIYHGTVTGSTMDLVDLERVEVLRGPQGTLFGINTMGGAMRLISKKPMGDGTGRLEVTTGSRSRLDVKGSGDFTVIQDKLFARVTGVAKRQDGYGQRLDFTCEMIRRGTPQLAGIGDGKAGVNGVVVDVAPGSDQDNASSFPQALDPRGSDCVLGKLGGSESLGGRLQLRYLASDVLEFNLSGDFSTQVADPSVEAQLTARNDDSGLAGSFAPNVMGRAYQAQAINKYGRTIGELEQAMVSPDPYTNFAGFGDSVNGTAQDPDTHLKAYNFAGTADYDITEKTHLKVISGYRSYRTTWTSDSDLTPFSLLQTPYLQSHHAVQAEAQLTGLAFDDRIDWTLGAFHYHGHSRGYNWLYAPASGLDQLSDDIYTASNVSGFGHVNFKLTDRLSISGGLRYTDEEKTNLFRHYGNVVRPDPYKFGSDHVSYQAGIDFQATERVFLYASVADGFTSAGVTPRIFVANQLQQLDGEQVTSYEVGAKVELFDRKLRINSAVFYMDYGKRLVNSFSYQCNLGTDPDPGQPYPFGVPCPAGTPLAGGSGLPWFNYLQAPGEVKGFESEITLNPLPGLSFNAALGYNKFVGDQKDTTATNYRDPSALLQPKWNINAGAQYVVRLGGGTLTPRLDWSYQSDRTNGQVSLPQRDPDDIIPGYGLLNARVTYAPGEDGWQVAVAVLNLTDKFYWQSLGAATGRVAGSMASGTPAVGRVGTPARPREWLVTVSKKFQ